MKLGKWLDATAAVLSLLLVVPPTFAQGNRASRGRSRGARSDEGARARGSQPRRSGQRGRAQPRRGVPRRRAPSAPPRLRVYPEPRIYGYARPRVIVPVRIYPRAFFVFRPSYWLGFGLYIGYPVPYPLVFGYPTYVYGGGVLTAPPPPAAMYGGVSLDIRPDAASVSVDGVYVGIARDFSPTYQPLTLAPGRHHIELQAPGMVPLAFDVDIVVGEVLPFSGELLPQ